MANKHDVIDIEAVAGFLVKKDHILLAIKQKKVGAHLYMPYGGIVNTGESHEQAMVRELYEESEVSCSAEDLQKVGFLSLYRFAGIRNKRYQWKRMLVSVYLIHRWENSPRNTEEMKYPRWFRNNELPLEMMLYDDRKWLPKVLKGKNVLFEAFYAKNDHTTPGNRPRIETCERIPFER